MSNLLKLTLPSSSILLILLFKQSLDQGLLPRDWTHPKVILVFKYGDIMPPKNYCPDFLTSILRNLLEQVISSHVVSYLSDLLFSSLTNTVSVKKVPATHSFFISNWCAHEHPFSDTNCCFFVDFSKGFNRDPYQR